MMKLAVLLLCCVVVSGCTMSLQGDNGLTVAGNSTSNTVTLALDGTVVRGVLTDSGNATGSDNWLSMLGAGNVTISASGSTITITCEGGAGGNATYSLDSDKLDGEHGSYYLSTTGTAADSTLFAGFSAAQWATLIDTYALADIDTMDFTSDSGNASPSSQVLHVVGSGSVSTSASGHTLTITGSGAAGGLVSILSGTVRNSNDTERSATATSYTKKKETKLNASLRAVRVSFDLHGTGSVKAYGKLYVNGVAVGSEHQTTSPTYVTYTDDLSVGYVSGDLIQVYIYTASGAGPAYVRNFRLEYDAGITVIGDYTLQTPLACTADPTISVTNQDP